MIENLKFTWEVLTWMIRALKAIFLPQQDFNRFMTEYRLWRIRELAKLEKKP